MAKSTETLDSLLLTTSDSLEVIAQRAGIARGTIFGARTGRMPRRATIIKLAAALGVTVDRLVRAIEASRAASK